VTGIEWQMCKISTTVRVEDDGGHVGRAGQFGCFTGRLFQGLLELIVTESYRQMDIYWMLLRTAERVRVRYNVCLIGKDWPFDKGGGMLTRCQQSRSRPLGWREIVVAGDLPARNSVTYLLRSQ